MAFLSLSLKSIKIFEALSISLEWGREIRTNVSVAWSIAVRTDDLSTQQFAEFIFRRVNFHDVRGSRLCGSTLTSDKIYPAFGLLFKVRSINDHQLRDLCEYETCTTFDKVSKSFPSTPAPPAPQLVRVWMGTILKLYRISTRNTIFCYD